MTDVLSLPSRYEAFRRVKEAPFMVRLQPVKGWVHCINLNHFAISYDEETYGQIALLSPMLNVRITGKNLRPLCEALIDLTCDDVQEFNSEKFVAPEDPKAPLIESIEMDGPCVDMQRERFPDA
jgi:hypothetical protein